MQMENKLQEINEKLDFIIEALKAQKITNDHLDNHITFIQKTYDSLKTPLDFLKKSVNSMVGIKRITSP